MQKVLIRQKIYDDDLLASLLTASLPQELHYVGVRACNPLHGYILQHNINTHAFDETTRIQIIKEFPIFANDVRDKHVYCRKLPIHLAALAACITIINDDGVNATLSTYKVRRKEEQHFQIVKEISDYIQERKELQLR